MKLLLKIIITIAAVTGLAMAQEPVSDTDMGLSQTSVFDTPEPAAFDYHHPAPAIPVMSPLDVPVIPHPVKYFERITVERNRCVRCHLLPDAIGTEIAPGEPTPIPASHYLSDPSSSESPQLAGSRWVCTQCHVAQANTEPLVDNTSVD